MKGLISCLGAFAAILLAHGVAPAQDYPTRPIQVLIPFAGGSASDVLARIVTDKMAASLGQRFVIDNRPGAGGNIGTLAAVKAAPDGYTLLIAASGPLAVNKALYRNLPYDPERDLQPISLMAILPNIIVVNSKVPVNSVAELVALAKSRPKQLNYGSIGNGSSQHLAGAYFEQVAGIQMTHVPYRVTGQLVSDIVSGEIQVSFQLMPNVHAQLQAGQVRPLAVTAEKRLAALPDVPTIAEAGVPGYEAAGWFALLAPRGTPKPIIDRLHREFSTAMADPEVRQRFIDLGSEPATSTPDELAAFMAAEVAKWTDIIRRGGITIEGQ